MGDPAAAKTIKITARPLRRTAFEWYELKLVSLGADVGSAALSAERIYFIPNMDAKIPIAEGPPPLDWEGYHAGKHGVYERFMNLKGEEVSMGDLFFKEKYRWVQKQYLKSPNELKALDQATFDEFIKAAYNEKPPLNLSGLFDSEKFTNDVKALYDKFRADPKSTVWQARYRYLDGRLGELQTNVDFTYEGANYRIAVDAASGKALNFFRIEIVPGRTPMKFGEIVIKWVGKVTDVTIHQVEGSTITIEIASNWPGLLGQGVKAGAAGGAIVSSFLGAIDGFKKEGLVGGLKGLAIGALAGGVIGGGVGGIVALAQRIWPWVGKVAKIGGFVLTVVAILLDASETALDPQEFGPSTKDDAGNKWRYRNIYKTGSVFFPEYVPRGILVACPDGTVVQFGDGESGYESSYRDTPITVYAGTKKVKWHSTRTPEGSTMWWWMDLATQEEFVVAYESDAVMAIELARNKEETPYRFTPTQN